MGLLLARQREVRLILLMAASILTLFCNNPEQSGSSAGLLALTAPAASTSTTGWTVSNTVTNRHSRQTYRVEKATGTFSATTQPEGPPLNKGQDCWRLSAVTTGQFSAGTLYSQVSVIAVTSGNDQDGRAYFRVWLTDQADGTSGFSEIATDNFDRADENPIAGNWTSGPGSFADVQILSNSVVTSGTGAPHAAFYNAVGWPDDHWAECRITTGANNLGAGPAVRVAAADQTCYFASAESGSPLLRIRRMLAGVSTNLATVSSATFASTDSLGLLAIGSTLRVFKNRVQVGVDSVDTFITTGNAGLHIFEGAQGATVDNWAGGTPTLRELTRNAMVGTTVTNLSTTVAQTSSASTAISTSNLTNDFIFMQVAWERTGAGGATNRDVLIRLGSLTIANGSGLITPLFTVPDPPAAGTGGGYYYRMTNDWWDIV